MKVEITRNTCAGGYHIQIGDTPDLSDRDAALLISLNKAVKYVQKKSPGRPKKSTSIEQNEQVKYEQG